MILRNTVQCSEDCTRLSTHYNAFREKGSLLLDREGFLIRHLRYAAPRLLPAKHKFAAPAIASLTLESEPQPSVYCGQGHRLARFDLILFAGVKINSLGIQALTTGRSGFNWGCPEGHPIPHQKHQEDA